MDHGRGCGGKELQVSRPSAPQPLSLSLSLSLSLCLSVSCLPGLASSPAAGPVLPTSVVEEGGDESQDSRPDGMRRVTGHDRDQSAALARFAPPAPPPSHGQLR